MATRSSEGAPGAADRLDSLRAEALAAVRRYAEEAFVQPEFVPGETNVPVAGRVIGPPELEALTEASLDGWLTEGRFAREFSAAFAARLGRSQTLLVGSGSQANLLAVAATTSHLHERPLQAGDEVITPALGFSTTVGPLYQYGLVPVYVDVELDTFNPSLEAIEAAIGERTRAILIAHCLGQPVRRGGRGRALPRARPRAHRGLLRRPRLDLRRPAGRNASARRPPSPSTRHTT